MSVFQKRLLTRMIERLRDPARLSAAEQAQLDNLIYSDEREELARLEWEIKHFNDLMLYPAYIEFGHEHYNKASAFVEHIKWWTGYREGQLERIAKQEKKLKEMEAKGFRNPNAFLEPLRLIESHKGQADAVLSGIERKFDKLTEKVKRFFVPPGRPIQTYKDLPWPHETIENVVWPNHPNHKRQAAIELLERKLEAL